MNSVAQIHTSFTLLTSRDLTWSSGRHTWDHVTQAEWQKCGPAP